MANDCSERVCPFGLAHVDTPKGDLDSSSGALSGPSVTVVPDNDVYPYGTTEQFPAMTDSRGGVLANTAHYYMECSNKGLCDRTTATCKCLPGYEGSSCQRASCPSSTEGMCSGHGTCQTIEEIASLDYGNMYMLWDKDSSMGCKCDAGYYGPDCSKRQCKHGYDPLYHDDAASVRYSNWTYVIYTLTTTTVTGNYSIKFFDVYGEDWDTEPIDIGATCADVINALEALPNNVIPTGSVRCHTDIDTYSRETTTKGNSLGTIFGASVKLQARFTITFPKNAGKLKQIEINTHLDGNRPTLYTTETAKSTLGTYVYPNGFTGEFSDFVPDLCEGVLVTIEAGDDTFDVFGNLDTQSTKLLKRCLGSGNGNTAQSSLANEVYSWDHGTVENPHLVKLVDSTELPVTNLCESINDFTVTGTGVSGGTTTGVCYSPKPPGFYVAIYYDPVLKKFNLFNSPREDYSTTTKFNVFTTTGFLQVVSKDVHAYSIVSSQSDTVIAGQFHSNIMYTMNSTGLFPDNHGNVDCETYGTIGNASTGHLYACLNKNDYVMVLNADSDDTKYYNPKYLNIYQLKKVSYEKTAAGNDLQRQLKFDTGVNGLYRLGVSSETINQKASHAFVYKFTPPSNGGVKYADECSGRGICNEGTGTCQCFSGHTGDDCSVQNALAK